MSDEGLIQIEKKKNLSDHYYDNFQKHFERGRLSKSSEFLWGALHALLGAVGLLYGEKIDGKSAKVKDFSEKISNSLGDDIIYKGVLAGLELHANFYQDFLDKENIDLKRKIIEAAMEKLMVILNEKIKEIKEATF